LAVTFNAVTNAAQRAPDAATEQSRPATEAFAQGVGGNAPRGHARWNGFDITIEAPAGGVRRGTAPDGTPFATRVGAAYGTLRGVPPGADGQAPDVFLGPHPEKGGPVHVIDELDKDTGEFRQTRSMIGFQSQPAAVKAYLDTGSKSAHQIGGIKALKADEFRELARSGGLLKPVTPGAADIPGKRRSEVQGLIREVQGDAHPDDVALAGLLMHRHGFDAHDAFEYATLVNALHSGDISSGQMASVIGKGKTDALRQAALSIGQSYWSESANAP
jgi:Inorganic Pyrophosphatase